ncbi:hypothetical protein GCM10009702_15530 [Propioniferax innocua]
MLVGIQPRPVMFSQDAGLDLLQLADQVSGIAHEGSFRLLDPTHEVRDNGSMTSDDIDLNSPEFMAEAFVKRVAMYTGISEPCAEQWRLILDSMELSAALAGVPRVVWTLEDREAMRREDLGQDKDELVARGCCTVG